MNSSCQKIPCWIALSIVAILSGCKPGHVFRPKQSASAVRQVRTPDTFVSDVLLIADTHATNTMAPHRMRSNSAFADAWLGAAAMRPAQWEQWGSQILGWILEQPDSPKIIVHLGDVANISCRGEFARFAHDMAYGTQSDERQWYLAPGNHDSLVMGNWPYYSNPAEEDTKWNGECRDMAVEGSMDKTVFIGEYLSVKRWFYLAPTRVEKSDGRSCRNVNTNDPNVEAIVCSRDEPYDNFIIQKLVIADNVTMLLIDTTQYRKLPVVHNLRAGGVAGGIGMGQIEELRRWLDDLKEKKPNERIVLAGHFPIDSLDEESQRDLADIVSGFAVVTYLSAHIHAATNQRLHGNLSKQGEFLELNVASTIGWPMEYSYLRIKPTGPKTTEIVLYVQGVANQLEQVCRGQERFRSTTGYYSAYRHGVRSTYAKQRNTMYQKMFDELQLSEAIEPYKIAELSAGLAPGEILKDPAVATRVSTYERCQAVWASEAESELSRCDSGDPMPLKSQDLRPAKQGRAATEWVVTIQP
jgi:3',5'-cyclic AMP phosphodiesterase CpdA